LNAGHLPCQLRGMNDARLEIRLPLPHREKLEQLAAETGLSVGGLVRLATRRLLDDRASLLKSTTETPRHV
jgi:hypothetical protein